MIRHIVISPYHRHTTDTVSTPPGKLLKVLQFSPFSRAWKILEIDVGSEKFWKFDVKVVESC